MITINLLGFRKFDFLKKTVVFILVLLLFYGSILNSTQAANIYETTYSKTKLTPFTAIAK